MLKHINQPLKWQAILVTPLKGFWGTRMPMLSNQPLKWQAILVRPLKGFWGTRMPMLFIFLAGCVMPAAAQVNKETKETKEQQKVINVNKLDVIYEEENNEYQTVITDQPENKNSNIPPTLIAPEEDDDEELEQASLLYRPEQMGEGVESEFDILYATMDHEVIHYASTNELPSEVSIHLTDKEKNRKFCFPTNEKGRATSHFGKRRRRFHYGVDLAMPTGEPIYAVWDGIVRISKWNHSYGNLVVVRHFNGLETYYAHLSQRDVEPGDTVHAGQVIALCGNTGRSYGSHLHLEIRYMGKALNPEYLLDCDNHKLLSDEVVLTPAYFQKTGSSKMPPNLAALHRINSRAGTAKNDKSTTAANEARNPNAKPTVNPPEASAKYYKIRSGDTLSKIAKRHGTSVRRLCQLNGIKETTVLQIGRRIRVR